MIRTTPVPRQPRRRVLLALAAALLAPAVVSAQAHAERELLNSERIAQTFGSYGIEVLESDAEMRVSNLYSGDGAGRVTRTFALVRLRETIDPALAAQHERIVAGGSIGAVFTEAGWSVRKRHRFFGLLDSTPRLERMMGGIAPRALATHVYLLDVVKPGIELQYATIVEIHHPDYLALRDLRSIYGETYEPPVRVPELEALVDVLELARGRASDR